MTTTYPIAPAQAALIAECTRRVEQAQAQLTLVCDAVLRGHGVTDGTVSGFDPVTPSLTVETQDVPDARAPSALPSDPPPVPSPES